MTRIVITEFLETEAVDELKRRGYEVHYDSTLWNKRAELEKLVRDLPGLIVRNHCGIGMTQVEQAVGAGSEACPVCHTALVLWIAGIGKP